MNKNIREIYEQVAKDCSDECFNLNRSPIPWQWEEKYANAIIEKCLSMMPLCKEQNQIKFFFGLDTPEAQTQRVIDNVAKKLKDHVWETVPELDWESWHKRLIATKAIDGGCGTHCYDNSYRVGDMVYNLTYTYDSDKPIDVQRKKYCHD